ncbi:hypothetical protein PHIN3_339 [Sinorhizobium phage phiN3]|uniref:Uncharacterized protein n=1 Tax=Sinorhizobium phage phiN3 TaxID=1647405 RepID=A0A0F6WCT1_9CAUD|nr:hypothetical protein AVT40_gp194 [Sinorhizobium phage phiN3]AKF13602.1 hypothetical protein PHIN3_339 [Sinorhizobium phage phiN3]
MSAISFEEAKRHAHDLWTTAHVPMNGKWSSPYGTIQTVEHGEWEAKLNSGWTVRLSSHGSIIGGSYEP